MMARSVLRCALLGALALTTAPAVAQEDVAAFFRGRTLNVYVGSPPGGGYDTHIRLMARHLGKYLPGNPSIVPNNMPGAGGNLAAGYIYNVAPKDGTAFALVQPGAITDGIFGADRGKSRHEPQKFNYIGSSNREVDMCFVRSDAPVKKLQDTFTTELILGSSAEGGSSRDDPTIQNNILGAHYKIVSGYPGTRDMVLAMEKNEIQGICGFGYSSLRTQKPDWIPTGYVRILSQDNFKGNAEVNAMGVPRTPDFAKTDEDRKILEILYAQQEFGRPFFLPPGVPPARVEAFRRAFDKTVRDPDYLAEAAKLRIDIDPLPGEEVQALVTKLYAAPADLVEKARQALVNKNL